MTLADSIVINAFSISILLVILIYYDRNADKASQSTKLFLGIVQMAVLVVLVDTMGRFDGYPDSVFPLINQIGNFCVFLLSAAIPSLWLLYVNNYVRQEEKTPWFVKYSILTVNAIMAILVISSQFNGLLYRIDEFNIYQRGPLYLISPALIFYLMTLSTFYVLANHKKIQHTHFYPFIFFPIAPFIGTILQAFIYGYPFALMGLIFSLLMIAFFAQSVETNVDYLSGVYNRKRLEGYLQKKIANSSRGNTFSAIMADVNGLKQINDTYGHTIGDEALITISSLLRSILRSNDFVARYGGDEFCIILDTSNEETLIRVVEKINRQLQSYNEMSLKPYSLGLSMGYAVYDPQTGQSAKEFYNTIDAQMYEDKRKHHIANLTFK